MTKYEIEPKMYFSCYWLVNKDCCICLITKSLQLLLITLSLSLKNSELCFVILVMVLQRDLSVCDCNRPLVCKTAVLQCQFRETALLEIFLKGVLFT